MSRRALPALARALAAASARGAAPPAAARALLAGGAAGSVAGGSGAAGSGDAAGGIVSFPLAQTGEGISECELVQWHVKARGAAGGWGGWRSRRSTARCPAAAPTAPAAHSRERERLDPAARPPPPQEGDEVEEFQALCEVQSDKAAIEITSRCGGGGGGGGGGRPIPARRVAHRRPCNAAARAAPRGGRYAGTVVRLHAACGEMVQVGAPLVDIRTDAAPAGEAQPGAAAGADTADSGSDTDAAGGGGAAHPVGPHPLATPAVRRLARELGVELGRVRGSGPDGRVLREDVERFKSGLESSIADSLVDRIAERSGSDSVAQLCAAAATAEEEAAAGAAALAEAEAAAAGGGGGAGAGGECGGGGGGAAATAAGASAAAAAVTRVPLRGYRRWAAGARAVSPARGPARLPLRSRARSRAADAPPTRRRACRRRVCRAMVRSAVEAGRVPTFHYLDELPVDRLLAARALLREHPALRGANLTLLPFIIKALSLALAAHPGLNVSLEPGGGALLQRGSHNVGVAMATSAGLVVPNIKQARRGSRGAGPRSRGAGPQAAPRDAPPRRGARRRPRPAAPQVECLSIPEVAAQLAHLQQLAAAGKLGAEDVSHGSLTISNIGALGGTWAAPLLNPPEAAIVALGRVAALPRYDAAGRLSRQNVLPLSWGGDHRVLDGAALAEFSNTVKALLVEPERMLMYLR
ncbi:Dbt [Scenedesmus sp. PABB004]|nr:Dbt [Scenedesmus sp. PABB004]